MNYNHRNFLNMENRTGLSMEDFVLLQAAKAGDDHACGKLFLNHQDEVETMHKYGPDGTHPKKFGFSKSFNGATYKEASGYCYLCFHDCVSHYDMNSGKPFMAWVRGVFAKRGMDWVNDRNPDDLERQEAKVLAAHVDVFRMDDLCQETSREEEMMTEEGLNQVRLYLQKVGVPELETFTDNWLKLGNSKKNPMTSVAESMGVTRQTSHNYMNTVKALVKGHFGNHFYGRD